MSYYYPEGDPPIRPPITVNYRIKALGRLARQGIDIVSFLALRRLKFRIDRGEYKDDQRSDETASL